MSLGKVVGRLALVTAILFVLACIGLAFPFEIVLYLVTGWVSYVMRVGPEVTIVWGNVALAVLCLVAFAIGAHAFSTWLYSHLSASAEPVRIGARWPVRWTAALVAVVVLMFVAGIATAGVGHQVGWLVASRDLLTFGGGARDAARRSQSVNNLKQIGLGVHNYHEEYKAFPAGATATRYGELLHSWQTAVLPYIEQQEVYNSIDRTLPWDDPGNVLAFQVRVSEYLNSGIDETHDAQGYALSHYTGNARVLGGVRPMTIAEITDGTAMTILAGEVASGYLPWGRPGNWRDPALGINRAPNGFGGPFKGGADILFSDGSVRFIKDTISPELLKSLGSPAGHETISADSY